MPDALETQVLIAARDSLLHISPGDGYATRPRVEIGPGPSGVTKTLANPLLLIHDAGGSKATRIIHHPPTWEHDVRFAVECFTTSKGEDGRVRELSNLTGDLRRRLLRADRRLGGLLTSDLMESDPDETDEELDKPVGWARLDFVARVTTTEEE